MLLAVVGDVRLVVVAPGRAAAEDARRASRSTPRRSSASSRSRRARSTRRSPTGSASGRSSGSSRISRSATCSPRDYQHIAGALKTRRSEREHYIEELKAQLQGELRAAGIEARDRRPAEAHLQHLAQDAGEAARLRAAHRHPRGARAGAAASPTATPRSASCTRCWQFIPGEFDDYIATPKDNLLPLDPHRGDRARRQAGRDPDPHPRDARQCRARRRRALALQGRRPRRPGLRAQDQPAARAAGARRRRRDGPGFPRSGARRAVPGPRLRAVAARARSSMCRSAARRWISPTRCTPTSATACRGAKVNGRMVPLDYRLENGETVEIIAAKTPQPVARLAVAAIRLSRQSAPPQQGARLVPQAGRDAEQARGPAPMLERELQRLGRGQRRRCRNCWRELKLREHRGAARRARASARSAPRRSPARSSACCTPARQRPRGRRARPRRRRGREPEVEVQGIGDLLSTYARCCKPVPPEPIVGYITVGPRRQHPRAVLRESRAPARARRRRGCSPVAWGEPVAGEFPVDIEVQAFDRRGLVRDVSAALADEKISISGDEHAHRPARDHIARMQIGISITGLPQLSRVLGAHRAAAEHHHARRRRQLHCGGAAASG